MKLDTVMMLLDQSISEQQFDVTFSGTTLCSVILTPKSIIVCNLGDSRAVICRNLTFNQESKIDVSQLTTDHKPELNVERDRILKSGGRVFPYTNK